MRLPNGYGSVYKLSGNRRKPYCVRVTDGWAGKQIYKYIGYYETKVQALEALAEYHKTPAERNASLTFSQVYDKWSKEHFKTIGSAEHYKRAYKASIPLYSKLLSDITQSDLQALIDNESVCSNKRGLRLLYKSIWSYAESQEIISKDKNRTEYLKAPPQEKSDKHQKFTNKQIEILWNNLDNIFCKSALVLIYTGARPTELLYLKSNNIHEDYFHVDKGKTSNAIRDVPIHEAIKPFFAEVVMQGINTRHKYELWGQKFKKEMSALGMDKTPYDCRHTFASLWADNALNEMYRRSIQGHSAQGIGEKVYTHISIEKLKEEVDKLPTKFADNIRTIDKTA